MGSSSESGWKKSDSSRGSDPSAPSDRNLRVHHTSRLSSSPEASRDSFFRNGREVKGNAGQASSGTSLRNQVLCSLESGDAIVSLRQWLDSPERLVDVVECLHIFRQIAELISTAHSQGIVVNNVRPSCFVMSSINRVSFIESASCSDSGSDSAEEESDNHIREVEHLLYQDLPKRRARLVGKGSHPDISAEKTYQLISSQGCVPFIEEREDDTKESRFLKQPFPMKTLLLLETTWYTSPEEIAGGSSSCASDIYRLGVLLFELFCTFSSTEGRSSTMSSLRHRVLPPHILLKWPKEASFCLWLLHPDPSSRPKMGDLLQSDFLTEPRDDIKEREAAIELGEKLEEQELLLDFLGSLCQTKKEAASKLQDTISLLSSDIEEVGNKQRESRRKLGLSSKEDDESHLPYSYLPLFRMVEPEEATSQSLRKRGRRGLETLEQESLTSESRGSEDQENLLSKQARLVKNFKKLETAYLMTRCSSSKPSRKPSAGQSAISSNSRGSVVLTERSVSNSGPKGANCNQEQESGWVNPFLDGLCKYLSFSKLRVKADLKQGDLLSSSNLVCSVSFDRDGEFFASAGVNKKIKVFECDAILNEDRDIHYPVVEMASRSKLSSICWNSYIKSQIASSNFEGVVQVWDVTRGQVFMDLKEHEKRVWAVDFSLADPTILASGSDDGSVKLWSINQGTSIGTIRTKANVCCVQFPLDSGRSFAFGSADHKVYYYDLRNPKIPLYTLVGHNKTVSYVKFVNPSTLVSASTDNSIKLWDLSTSTSRILDSPIQSFSGHVNMKNFVGLSVSDGYIATGSETNEVFVYHKAFPMPALSYKFNSMHPSHGHESDGTAQFISSVCWRGHSSTLVAANSTGDIKILEMV